MGGDDESNVGTCGNVAVVVSVLVDKSRTYGKSFPHTRKYLRLSADVSSAKHAFPGTCVATRSCDLPSLQSKRQRHFR